MAKTGNKGRINNKDNYKDRPPMKGEQEYMGEDIGNLGMGKGADRKRLVNEIDDNVYDADTELEIVDDPRFWGEDLQLGFTESIKENYEKNLIKYVKIIKKTYDWLRDDKIGQAMTSVVAVRSAIGMSRAVWIHAEAESEEFLHYSNLIKDIISARISHLGMTDSKGQIFKIFSIKNILPEDYADKREINNHQIIEVIEIGSGSKKEEIDKSKKRLKK
jgi:hypothetical protein